MNWFSQFFGSYYFVTFVIAWLFACISKAILVSVRNKKPFRLVHGFRNGGMPSSHSATVSSITTGVGLTTGFTPIFFVALVMSLIVISDAFGIRRNLGQQGDALNKILKGLKKDPVKIVYGHSVTQVFIGTLLGVGIAVVMFFLYF